MDTSDSDYKSDDDKSDSGNLTGETMVKVGVLIDIPAAVSSTVSPGTSKTNIID